MPPEPVQRVVAWLYDLYQPGMPYPLPADANLAKEAGIADAHLAVAGLFGAVTLNYIQLLNFDPSKPWPGYVGDQAVLTAFGLMFGKEWSEAFAAERERGSLGFKE